LGKNKDEKKEKMKSILFLGGGQLGVPTIKWARQIGFNVIVNDKNVKAPGLELGDVTTNFDSTDVRSLLTWVTKNNNLYNIIYSYCSSDFGLLTAAMIHEYLNIKAPNVRAIINALDKELMKDCWNGINKIVSPKSILIKDGDDLKLKMGGFTLPLVIKPRSSSGSRGVSIVTDTANLEKAYLEALAFSVEGDVIIEEYIGGTHHDVNGMFWGGEFYHCGVMDRYFIPGEYPVSFKGDYPSELNLSVKMSLYEQLNLAASALGITHGPVKADFIISDNIPYLLEVSPRFHGDILTCRSMNALDEINPIFQLLKMIFDDGGNFLSLNSQNVIGSWKAYFSEEEWASDALGEKILLNRNAQIQIKNNTNYYGLGWTSKKIEI
jgi:carbamoylphosphate synthase large subunit